MASVQSKPTTIPKFDSYEEEADFWDTHSPFDFPDEFDFEAGDVRFANSVEIVRVKNWHESLADVLAKLPEGERQVLSLSMLGLSDAQIARITGYSTSHTQKALREARRKTKSLTTSSSR